MQSLRNGIFCPKDFVHPTLQAFPHVLNAVSRVFKSKSSSEHRGNSGGSSPWSFDFVTRIRVFRIRARTFAKNGTDFVPETGADFARFFFSPCPEKIHAKSTPNPRHAKSQNPSRFGKLFANGFSGGLTLVYVAAFGCQDLNADEPNL